MFGPTANDQALSELVESDADLFEGGGPCLSASETRAYPRFPFRGRAMAVAFAPKTRSELEPKECEVLTTDVSRGGLSILCRKQLYPGQQLLLVLNATNRLVEVCWCCRVWPGLYSAGCQFISAPPVPAEEA
jgi:PilZ domain-containing protein